MVASDVPWQYAVGLVITGASVVVAFVWKEVASNIAKSIVSYGTAFASMPIIVKDLDRRLGQNGRESVFELLHRLEDASAATIMKERLRADRDGAKMWHSDSAGRCIWASKGLQELVGSTFDERFRGMNWLNLFFNEDRDDIGAAWTNAIGNGDPFIMRTRYQHADGYEIPVRLEAYPLPGGAVLGMVFRL